jgi:hypothetical protein
MDTIIYLAGDMHINSTVALCAPRVELDDGGTYHASRQQRALWESWQDFWGHDYPGRKIAVLNGDIGELDTKRRSTQLVAQNKATITKLLLTTLEPAYNAVEKLIFMRGTMAHTGKAGWIEEALADDCDAAVRQSDSIASWYHFRGEIGGIKTDIAHHTSMGRMPWTAPNAANRIAALAMYHYGVTMGEHPPDLLVRSHNHRYADSGDNYPVWAVCLPCWQLITEYGYRIGGELSLPDIGGVIVTVRDGAIVKKDKLIYKPKASKAWVLKI